MHPGSDPTRRMPPGATRRFDEPPTARMPGPSPQVLGGRYRLDGLLGSGGMADVHRAEDLRLHRPVAVKIFRPGTDPDGERRFREEAQTLAGLRHPGLVAVHDFAVEQQRAYLVMELVDGPTLAQEIARERYDATGATQIGLELARVLAYVHAEGIVHRDVKPTNVLVEQDGRVRLADFGISRLVGTAGMTSVDGVVGTAAYLSPEQVQGRAAGPPADVYALGLVLLEALTGRPEYGYGERGGDGWETAEERLRRPPEVPRDLTEPLRSTLREMTDTDPARRPDARRVAERLGQPAPYVAEAPLDEPTRGGRGRRALLIALAAVALLLVAVFALTRGDEPVDPTAQPDGTTPSAVAPEPPVEVEPSEEPSGGIDLPDIPTELPDLSELPELPSDLPELPSDLPDIPSALPELPEVPQEARNAWEQFTDWLSRLFS